MRKLLSILAAGALSLTACQKQATEAVYTLDQVFVQADSLVGDTILLEGTVSHICKHSGCKAFFRAEEGGTLCVKAATAGRFVPECVNNTVRVRGIVRAFVKEPVVDSNEQEPNLKGNCGSEKVALQGYYIEAVSYQIITE